MHVHIWRLVLYFFIQTSYRFRFKAINIVSIGWEVGVSHLRQQVPQRSPGVPGMAPIFLAPHLGIVVGFTQSKGAVVRQLQRFGLAVCE